MGRTTDTNAKGTTEVAGKTKVMTAAEYLKSLPQTEDGKKEAVRFEKLSDEDKATELMLLAQFATATAVAGIDMVDAKPEQDNITILSPGHGPIRAGAVIQGYLMGTYHVFSKEHKENWKEFYDREQNLYYANDYFKFKLADGKEIAIWASPTLSILKKVLTNTSGPSKCEKDPFVSLTYVGKIEGKEVLKKEYGIELQKGNSCHVFRVQIEKGAKVFPYQKLCLNHLNAPTPIGAKSEDFDVDAANLAMFEQLSGAPANMIGFDAESSVAQ